jgi:hypothetical protein
MGVEYDEYFDRAGASPRKVMRLDAEEDPAATLQYLARRGANPVLVTRTVTTTEWEEAS